MKDYTWFKHYPDKIPHEIDPDRYSSLADLFNQCVERYRELPAFESFGKILTYDDMDRLTRSFAAFLQKQGLTKGDRVAIQLPNTLQYPVALFGALRAGLVVVNTNPLYTSREMKEKFRDSGAKAIVIMANYAANLEEIISETEIKTVVVTEIGDLIGGFKGSLINFVVKKVKKMVPPFNLPGSVKLNDALKAGEKEKFTPVELNKDDIAFLQVHLRLASVASRVTSPRPPRGGAAPGGAPTTAAADGAGLAPPPRGRTCGPPTRHRRGPRAGARPGRPGSPGR